MTAYDINKDLYRPMIKSLGITVGEDNSLYRGTNPEALIPVELNKKRIVLPTKDKINGIIPDKEIAFHPLSENVARGDSPVFSTIRQLAIIHGNLKLAYLLGTLAAIANDTESHGELKPEALSFLKAVPELDKKTLTNLEAVRGKIDINNVRFVSIRNARNSELNGKIYKRTAHLTFPIFDELIPEDVDPKKTVYWNMSSMRKKDIAPIKALLSYIIPGWDKPDTYSRGSDNMECPSLLALFSAFVAFSQQLDDIYALFDNRIDPEIYKYMTDVDYGFNVLLQEKCSTYRSLIPPMEGNVGPVPKSVENTPGLNDMVNITGGNTNITGVSDGGSTGFAPQPQTTPTAPMNTGGGVWDTPQPQQQPQQPPAAATTIGGLTFNTGLFSNAPQQQQQSGSVWDTQPQQNNNVWGGQQNNNTGWSGFGGGQGGGSPWDKFGNNNSGGGWGGF